MHSVSALRWCVDDSLRIVSECYWTLTSTPGSPGRPGFPSNPGIPAFPLGPYEKGRCVTWCVKNSCRANSGISFYFFYLKHNKIITKTTTYNWSWGDVWGEFPYLKFKVWVCCTDFFLQIFKKCILCLNLSICDWMKFEGGVKVRKKGG